MRKALVILLGVCLLAMFGSVSARDAQRSGKRLMRDWSDSEHPDLVDPGMNALTTSAQVDTFCMIWFDFEQLNWQNWTTNDNTAQYDDFWHLDNFAGLGGGDYGGLVAQEGTQSWWCGARPNPADLYLCGWVYPPGYGNSWNQVLMCDSLAFTGVIDFTFLAYFDSEADWDFTYLEYDAGDDNWIEVDSYDGVQQGMYNYQLLLGLAATKIRFNFLSDGAWSDQDGLYNTDGAAIVDSLVIVDATGLRDFENCEPYVSAMGNDVGDKESDGDQNGFKWRASSPPGFGIFAGLRTNLQDYDPCGDNFGTQIIFFNGSNEPSGSYPGLFDTPHCSGPGGVEAPCQDESIISPIINMTTYSSGCDENQDTPIDPGKLPNLGGALLRFTVYRDLPLANLTFYTWGVRNLVAGCPGQWLDRNYVYYGPDRDYIFTTQDVSDLVGADPIQVQVGMSDMCQYWYLQYGNCVNHTPSPWIDNVRIYRYETVGPQWSSRDLDLFQDQFPTEGLSIEAWVRADAANDLNSNEDPIIRPGDSAVVTCTSPLGGGIKYMGDGWPMVYLHTKVSYIGCSSSCPNHVHPKPANIAGVSLEGTYGRYVGDDGTWTTIQCEEARVGPWPGTPVPDKFMVDLNDSVLTRGYMVEYYFSAQDSADEISYHPNNAHIRKDRTYGIPGIVYQGVSYIFEMTCLPLGCSDILYVDDFHGRGTFWGNVEQYYNPSFVAVIPSNNWPERYDVNNPSSLVGNGLSRSATSSILTCYYRKIIWDSGNLSNGTIGDGSTDSDKTNDCQLLIDWMTLHPDSVAGAGLWVSGDDVAQDLAGLTSPQATALLTTWCGVLPYADPNWGSYYALTGDFPVGVITPKITGTSTGIFCHGGPPCTPDEWYAFGGCAIINQFDCMTNAIGATIAATYPNYGPHMNIAAVIQNTTTNASNAPIRTMWFGHSYMYMRDVAMGAPIIRAHVMKDIISWMENPTNIDITKADVPKAYKLDQNFPNPFNPQTTIRFDVRERGHVSLKIYNVAGQLVKSLVDGVKDANSYEITWDGTNNHGAKVASGVYFYKMQSKSFNQTKKMVLLR